MSRDSAVLRLVDNCLDATSLTPKKSSSVEQDNKSLAWSWSSISISFMNFLLFEIYVNQAMHFYKNYYGVSAVCHSFVRFWIEIILQKNHSV